jgi:hypothetical protein
VKKMTTKHKPGKILQSILREMRSQALVEEGTPVSRRLTNNLRIDVRITGGIVALLISRSSVYPSDTEWRTVCRHWPYPIQVKFEKIVREEKSGLKRHFLRGNFPLQLGLLDPNRTQRQPVNPNPG